MKGAFLIEEIKRGITVIKLIKNWQDYFFNYLELTKKKPLNLKMKDGLLFTMRTKTVDKYLFTETVLEDQYGINIIESGSVVIDLGAQAGFFSVFASKKAVKVFSFEPVAENFKILKKNIESNNLEDKIFPFNLAVSDKKGKERIFLSENHSGGHSVYGFEEKNKNKYTNQFIKSKGFNKKNFIEVNSVTLNEIFKLNKISYCDFLKIDIEGAEYKVLYRLPDSCFRKIKRIAMECHNLDERKNNMLFLIGFLKSKGFKVKLTESVLLAENNSARKIKGFVK